MKKSLPKPLKVLLDVTQIEKSLQSKEPKQLKVLLDVTEVTKSLKKKEPNQLKVPLEVTPLNFNMKTNNSISMFKMSVDQIVAADLKVNMLRLISNL